MCEQRVEFFVGVVVVIVGLFVYLFVIFLFFLVSGH